MEEAIEQLMATFFAGSPPTGSRNPCLSLCICGFGVQHEEDTDNDMCPGEYPNSAAGLRRTNRCTRDW